ncbi:MAG: DNA alkylation repair protein [Bacteroidota bacterium]
MSIPAEILNRKGARKVSEIPPEVLQLLNTGKIETANLMEWLAVDQLNLVQRVLAQENTESWLPQFEEILASEKKPTANTHAKLIGLEFGKLGAGSPILESLQSHESDVVRCWACWAFSLQYEQVQTLLPAMKRFAADRHFGVREVVIFAVKEKLIQDLDKAVEILANWTSSEDENVRRFVAETLRPVGVWVKKVAEFQQHPQKGLALIEPLKADPSKYVQNAVANWLNDASKSQPGWVKEVCTRWTKESDSKATKYIVKRGLRTVNKG